MVGPREQKVDLFPGFSASTLVIDSSACSAPSAQRCSVPTNGSIQSFDAEGTSTYPDSSSEDIAGDSWGAQQANVLNLQGVGQYYPECITLPTGDAQQISLTSDEHSIVVSNNYTSQYIGGATYTLSTGFVSIGVYTSGISKLMLPIAISICWSRQCLVDCIGRIHSVQVPHIAGGLPAGSHPLRVFWEPCRLGELRCCSESDPWRLRSFSVHNRAYRI